MMICKIMIKAPINDVKNRFKEFNDIEILESKRKNWTLIEDDNYVQFVGWEVSSWIEFAEDLELIFAYYDEDMSAEFIHIKNGICIRAYQKYEGELDINEGNDLDISISDVNDIADYIDNNMN